MTEEGTYRSLDLGALQAAFDHMSPSAQLFRPVADFSTQIEDYVYQAAVGPTVFSTGQELVPMTAHPVWDVNFYYRALGIEWPYRPTKKQLRKAYLLGRYHLSDYATYALKRLLDAEFRRHYDARPLGQPVDDVYRWHEVRKMTSKYAKEQSLATGRTVTVADILGEDLVSRMEAEAESERQGAAVQAKRDEVGEEGERVEDEGPFIWPYAYYLWNSRELDDLRLSQWQAMIVASCARQGLSLHVAVGYVGRTASAAIRKPHISPGGGYVEIIFLHEDIDSSQELADSVVGTYYTCPYGQLEEPIGIATP